MVITDPAAVILLKMAVNVTPHDCHVFQGLARDLKRHIVRLAACVGFCHPRLSAYSLRRGGATWHFHHHGSLDRTAVAGRWAQVNTARIYIEGAAAEWALWQIPPHFHKVIRNGNKVLSKLAKAHSVKRGN